MGGIAPDILFMEHVPQMCFLSNTVADVLKDLSLSLVVVRAVEEFILETLHIVEQSVEMGTNEAPKIRFNALRN